MKKIMVVLLAACFCSLAASAQPTAREVAEKVRENCLEIKNGEYTLTRSFKFFTAEDTIVQNGKVVFEKQPADSLFGMVFWIENLTDSFSYYYYNNAMHTVRLRKKTVTLDTVKSEMKGPINGNITGNYINFSFTKTPMGFLDDSTTQYSYDPEWLKTLNRDTIIILVKYADEADFTEQWARWHIDAKTYYPVVKEYHVKFQGGVQYEHFKINSYSFNKKEHTDWLKANKFAGYDTFYSQPYVAPVPLPNDTAAPYWEAITLAGDSINSTTVGGKLLLVDFWYRACYPCVKAIPFLKTMSDKYGKSGLVVVGLNPYDYKNRETESFKIFMEKQMFTYTVGFVTNDFPKAYNVRAYPTLYLIANGKIIHSQIGYGEKVDAEIEKIIREYLEKN